MSYITAAQRATQRIVTAPTFTDTCQRLTHSTVNDDGYATASYAAGASFACSFQGNPERDAQGETQVPMSDAKLYYALGTTLDPSDRVKITHIYDEAVAAPQSYSIVGGPFIEHNVMKALLQLVTDGSDEEE